MKKNIFVLIFVFVLSGIADLSFAQDDTSEELSVEVQVEQLLENLADVQSNLKKQKEGRSVARKLRLVTRRIVRAVNSIPPNKCLDRLRLAMDDFFSLASSLEIGVSCAPPVLPPFLRTSAPITIDCVPPDDLTSDQLGTYGEVLGVYNSARNVFHIDSNENEIPDACEGDIE